MLGKRLLVIDKLVLAVPDSIPSKDGREELTIDDMLEWLLRYRKTADAVTQNNRYGNFRYFSADIPKGANPNDESTYNMQTILDYLSESPEKHVGGMMTALVYDDELKSYRNAYTLDEDEEFQERKAQLLEQRAREAQATAEAGFDYDRASEDPDAGTACEGCEELCGETCPDEGREEDDGNEAASDAE
jgi:hypothetical protein